MIRKKIFAGLEIILGLFLMVCIFFNKSDSLNSAIGFDLSLQNAIIILGIFYLLRGMIQLVVEMSDPGTTGFMKRFFLFLEVFSGTIIVILAFSDGRETPLEKILNFEPNMYHGIIILGVFYAVKSVLQLLFEQVGEV